MKKFLLILLIFGFVLVGCSSEAITFGDGDDVIEKFENEETFVFVIGNSTCSACTQYKPIVRELIDNKDVQVTYIETDKVDKEPVLKLVSEYLDNDLEWTPTTYFVIDGEVEESIPGSLRYTDLVSKFEEHGFIE